MDVNIDEQTIIPTTDNTNNLLVNVLKDTKVSFVVLLCIVIGIYVGMFFILDNNSSNETNVTKNIFILFLEVVL